MAELIGSFFDNERNRHALDTLLAKVEVGTVELAESDGALVGTKFVFTGGLESLSRLEAKELVEAAGGRVVSSVSKDDGLRRRRRESGLQAGQGRAAGRDPARRGQRFGSCSTRGRATERTDVGLSRDLWPVVSRIVSSAATPCRLTPRASSWRSCWEARPRLAREATPSSPRRGFRVFVDEGTRTCSPQGRRISIGWPLSSSPFRHGRASVMPKELP